MSEKVTIVYKVIFSGLQMLTLFCNFHGCFVQTLDTHGVTYITSTPECTIFFEKIDKKEYNNTPFANFSRQKGCISFNGFS